MGLRLAAQGTSTGSAKSWAVILWRRELRTFGLKTPLDKIIYYIHLFVFKNTIFAQKYFFVIDHFFQSRSYQVTEEIPRDQSRMPFRHFPSPDQRLWLWRWKNFYDNDAKNSFDLLFDPGDVVGNVCIYARCWLRRERTVPNENSMSHLVAVVLKESLTDHTDQSVLFTRVQDCQWSTTVPLYQVDFVDSSCSGCLPCK